MCRRHLMVVAGLSLSIIAAASFEVFASSANPQVKMLRTPAGGIQPQTTFDPNGVLHMIYFKGDAAAGDIEYIRSASGSPEFSEPIRANSQPGSAVAVGTVRGPQMAMGRNGRVYAVWFGSDKAEPRGPDGATPVLFSRLNDSGTAFEPQRSVMQFAKGVDGGLSVAADLSGNVYVVWHAMGSEAGEAHRRVYLARSADDGKTFSRERAISPAILGACGCCGMRAAVDARGTLYVLYRAAEQGVDRDMTLLKSEDHGDTFASIRAGPWRLNACPMSTASLNPNGHLMLAAWETVGQVFFEETGEQGVAFSTAIHPLGEPNNRKHPAVSADSQGWVLLAWTEGTGWKKGGSLAWQLYNPSGYPVGAVGHAPGVPVWDLPSIFADREGNFTIVY
jgi:hypothetical protein